MIFAILIPVLCLALYALLRGLFLLIMRPGRRRRGAMAILASPIIALTGTVAAMDIDARLQGWPSFTAMSSATRAGITDPAIWAEQVKADEAAAAARKAEAEATAKASAAAEAEAKARAEAEAEAAFQATGRHCLNPFSGANDPLIRLVTRRLRDPDSFEHIETTITPVKDGMHTVVMTYRARNGFGGMNVSQASGLVESATCTTTILSLE